MNRPQTLADRIGAKVTYRGQNVRKQHMFCNGTQLVTDIFPTLEAGVARFGKRLEIDEKTLKYSTVFHQGYADGAKGVFKVRDIADQQERFEYGSGYLKRLLEPAVAVPPPVKAMPLQVIEKPIVMEPVPAVAPVIPSEIPFVPPAPKRRGRPKGSKNKVEIIIDE